MKRRVPSWEALTRIGRARVMSLTILVPIIGYMIIFNQQIVQYFNLSPQIIQEEKDLSHPGDPSIQITDGTRTRLFYFYFGLTFLGLGSIVYQLACPSLLKEHASDREFVREEVRLMTLRRARSLLASLETRKKTNQSRSQKLQEIGNNLAHASSALISEQSKILESPATDLMLMQWQDENWSNQIARALVAALYTGGFTILAVPSAEIFVKVLRAFLSGET